MTPLAPVDHRLELDVSKDALSLEDQVIAVSIDLPAENFEALGRHVALHLGKGAEVRGEAGTDPGLDQQVLTWTNSDGRYVRVVKRSPFDPSMGALIALSKMMDEHEYAKQPPTGMTPGRCRVYTGLCPAA